jgi:hypothetical protein
VNDIKKYVDPISKGRMQKKSFQKQPFCVKLVTKSGAKVYEAFFWQGNYIFFMFFNFFSLKGLSCILNNFLRPPRARFNHYKGLIALPIDYRILQKSQK